MGKVRTAVVAAIAGGGMTLAVIIAGGLNLDAVPSASAATIVSGPCPTEHSVSGGVIVYPLDHPLPGIVTPTLFVDAGGVHLQSVCLEAGWTVEERSDPGKVQLTFFYQGTRAIDFKMEPGKTDIRFR